MSKKKLLIFIDWFTPGFRAGGPVSSCVNLVDHFKEEFDISVVTSDTDYMETSPYSGVKSDEWTVRPDGVRVYYFSKEHFSRKRVSELLYSERADFIYLNGIFSKGFTLFPLRSIPKEERGKVVLAARGMLSPAALRIKRTKKNIFLFLAKLTGLFEGITFQATNKGEEQDIRNIFGHHSKIRIAPNLPRKEALVAPAKRKKETGTLKLINVARIAPEKNLLFALEALLGTSAQVELDFYGPVYSEAYWSDCKKMLDRLPANVKAKYRGVLQPGEVEAALGRYHFLFMPSRSENFGHVILQSLSAGTPVIIGDQTPWKELEQKQVGFDLPLKVETFTAALERAALLSQQEFDLLSENAFRYASMVMNDPSVKEQTRLLFQ